MSDAPQMPVPQSTRPVPRSWPALLTALLLGGALLGSAAPLRAQPRSDAAALSAGSSTALSLPVASVAASGLVVLGSTALLTVVAVQVSATGTVWILERASDGARVVLRLSGELARGASVGAGTALMLTTLSAGTLLTASGEAVCFVPNERGQRLLHDERITFS